VPRLCIFSRRLSRVVYRESSSQLYFLKTYSLYCRLHNAEFQGLWPMRTDQESDEVSRVYNLSKDTIEKYVQFGEVFNLLHAGVSYLRVHQKGFGAVGVSNKYGARSFARYRKSLNLQSHRSMRLISKQPSSGDSKRLVNCQIPIHPTRLPGTARKKQIKSSQSTQHMKPHEATYGDKLKNGLVLKSTLPLSSSYSSADGVIRRV
jgi:hypothetical protein